MSMCVCVCAAAVQWALSELQVLTDRGTPELPPPLPQPLFPRPRTAQQYGSRYSFSSHCRCHESRSSSLSPSPSPSPSLSSRPVFQWSLLPVSPLPIGAAECLNLVHLLCRLGTARNRLDPLLLCRFLPLLAQALPRDLLGICNAETVSWKRKWSAWSVCAFLHVFLRLWVLGRNCENVYTKGGVLMHTHSSTWQ